MSKILRDQRVMFLLVGGANTALATLLFAIFVFCLGPATPVAVSLGLSWVVSVMLAFFAHRRLVFRVEGNLGGDFTRFVGVNFGGLLLNAAGLTILVDLLGLPPVQTQVGIVIFILVFNYLGHRYFSFRR